LFNSIAVGPEDSIFLMDAGKGELLALSAAGSIVEVIDVRTILDNALNQGLERVSITVDALGRVYMGTARTIHIWKPGEAVSLFAGEFAPEYKAERIATASALNSISDLHWHDGLLYVVDRRLHCVCTIDAQGAVRTVAGNGDLFASGDGGPATEAGLWLPHCVEVKPDHSLWIGCGRTSAFVIRRVEPGGNISTVHSEAWYQNAPEDWAGFWTPWKAQDWDVHALDVQSLESQGMTIRRERKRQLTAATTWMREQREARLRDGSRLVIMEDTQVVRIDPRNDFEQTVLIDRSDCGLQV
jgi:hypothetical protein